MPTIHVLDESVANKIAAGEVVERPASVVKELVENALDAGAERIAVELMGGGRDLVRVTDDGAGMSPEDVQLAILPHATSKIRTIHDLSAIATYGFRGEALPSVAAVSHLVVITRRAEDESGTLLACEGGTQVRVEPVGCPVGTAIAVRHLFFNTPARLKFLRQSRAELGRCVDYVARFSLAFPDRAFTVSHEGKQVFRADPSGDQLPRLAEVLGRDSVRSLVPFGLSEPLASVRGYASGLELHRPNRSGQYLFVNNRSIRSPVLSQAITRAYDGLLPPGRHPAVCLFLDMDPRLVDPNVHPTKQEVRFPREQDVFSLVVRALRDALLAADLIPAAAPPEGSAVLTPPPRIGGQHDQRRATAPLRLGFAGADTSSLEAAIRRRVEEDLEPSPSEPPAPSPDEAAQPAHSEMAEGAAAMGPEPRVLGQAMASYIIAEADGELILVDQHAAHERVLYERFVAAAEGEGGDAQGLLVPVTVELSAGEHAMATESAEELARLGLRIEPFGGGTVLIRSVPAVRGATRDPAAFLRAILADLAREDGEFSALRDPRARLCATAACRAAVKQGDPLTTAEMETLLRDLAASGVRFTCPHARPAVVRLTAESLGRYFHRK